MIKSRSNYTCLIVILTDFVLKKGENYHWQVFLKECIYNKKEKKLIRHITHDLSVFTNDWMILKEGKFGRNMRVYNA